jgi:oligoribonuclease NrnB/cAMP/cGMP phosphodiesterase (DHH superfamily)
MEMACDVFEHVYLYDHHKTAEDVYGKFTHRPNFSAVISHKHSGCTLARQMFDLNDEELAVLYSYVEDNDLWAHKLPHSKEFTAGIQALNLELDPVKNPAIWRTLESLQVKVLIEAGKAILAEKEALCKAFVREGAYVVRINVYEDLSYENPKVLAVDIHPDQWALKSMLGHELAIASDCEFGAVCVRDEEKQTCQISLRSNGVDTTWISKAFNGGGHRDASGFTVSTEMWDSWKQ